MEEAASRSAAARPLGRAPNSSPWAALRVVKTYAPDQNGAKRFARRYGEQLVCVRHRLNEAGTIRHTTVELLVESTPIAKRARSVVAVQIPLTDRNARMLLLAHGGEWDAKRRVWLVPRLVARNLRLQRNIVPIQG